MSNAEFQTVFTVGQSKITHAPAGEWSYDAERKSVCGRVTTGVLSYSSGKLIEVTCKSCNKIMDKASEAGFQETRESDTLAKIKAIDPDCLSDDTPYVRPSKVSPGKWIFERVAMAAEGTMCWVDGAYAFQDTPFGPMCQTHVYEYAEMCARELGLLDAPNVRRVDVSEVIPGDIIVGAEDMGLVRGSRQHVDGPGMWMIFGENYSDCFGAPQKIKVIRDDFTMPEADMPTVHEALGEPYVMEGRVMITIPGLTWPETGEPVELDEGTERFVITPGYSTQADCARMTSIKRYGKVLPSVRVTDLTYVGPLNP